MENLWLEASSYCACACPFALESHDLLVLLLDAENLSDPFNIVLTPGEGCEASISAQVGGTLVRFGGSLQVTDHLLFPIPDVPLSVTGGADVWSV